MRNKRTTLLALLAATAVVVNVLDYDPYGNSDAAVDHVRHIPKALGPWLGVDVPLEESVYEILETRAIVHRRYVDSDSDEIFLSLVHYGEANVGFHPPEQCLGAQGIPLDRARETIRFRTGGSNVQMSVNTLVQDIEGRKSLIYYFYNAGTYSGDNYVHLRLSVALNKLTNHEKGASLVRISTPVENGDTKRARSLLQRFLEDLYPYLKTLS